VGTLITDRGDGERIKNALLGPKLVDLDRPVVGVLSPDELALWRAFATAWRDGRDTIPPFDELGEVGRIVLRLLDALDETQGRVIELDGLLGEAQELLGVSGHALRAMKRLYEIHKRGESRVAETGGKREPSWLEKDFHALYSAALDVSESVVEPDRETPPQRNLRAQLRRLMPAFEECEVARRMDRQTREGN
jgi:hypothetical protein